MFKENNNKPTNLPTIVWALYNSWVAANQSKRAFTQEQKGPDFEGGWLTLRKQHEDGKYRTYSAAYGRCKQIRIKEYISLQEAIRKGLEWVNLMTYSAAKVIPFRRDVKAITNTIEKEIEYELPLLREEEPGSDSSDSLDSVQCVIDTIEKEKVHQQRR